MYFSKEDLEDAVGGAAVLVQLLDKDNDTVADASLVQKVIDTACADIDSAVAVRNQLPLVAPYPPSVVANALRNGVYYAHVFGTGGQGVPPEAKTQRDEAELWCERISLGTRSLGGTPPTTSGRQAIQVEPCADGVTRTKLRGLW